MDDRGASTPTSSIPSKITIDYMSLQTSDNNKRIAKNTLTHF